jgi:predicted transposase/invertase (TIGR01784 family)
MGIKNDLSFLIDNNLLVLVEHQSTINPNLPFRLLLYVSKLFEAFFPGKSRYGSKLVQLPPVEFFILYNGTDKCRDVQELKLTDAFKPFHDLRFKMDLEVKFFNINKGHNEEILKRSNLLSGYSELIYTINDQLSQKVGLKDSIKYAVEYCKQHNILKDFLSDHSIEVEAMLFQEFSLDEAKEVWREEGIEIGLALAIRALLAENFSVEKMAEMLNLDLEKVKQLANSDKGDWL